MFLLYICVAVRACSRWTWLKTTWVKESFLTLMTPGWETRTISVSYLPAAYLFHTILFCSATCCYIFVIKFWFLCLRLLLRLA